MKTILLAVACCLWGLPSVAFANATECESTGYGEGNDVACGGDGGE